MKAINDSKSSANLKRFREKIRPAKRSRFFVHCRGRSSKRISAALKVIVITLSLQDSRAGDIILVT